MNCHGLRKLVESISREDASSTQLQFNVGSKVQWERENNETDDKLARQKLQLSIKEEKRDASIQL
jgi:hypothetical protein